jgi:Putative abortive phage resistance protein AbiGi, antitoxin
MFKANMVCFCDIPVADLALHARKSSPFGLAFRKSLLLEKGASPVFYVASNGPTATGFASGSLADVFTAEIQPVHSLFNLVRDLNAPPPREPRSGMTEEEVAHDAFMLSMRVFSFLTTRVFAT